MASTKRHQCSKYYFQEMKIILVRYNRAANFPIHEIKSIPSMSVSSKDLTKYSVNCLAAPARENAYNQGQNLELDQNGVN